MGEVALAFQENICLFFFLSLYSLQLLKFWTTLHNLTAILLQIIIIVDFNNITDFVQYKGKNLFNIYSDITLNTITCVGVGLHEVTCYIGLHAIFWIGRAFLEYKGEKCPKCVINIWEDHCLFRSCCILVESVQQTYLTNFVGRWRFLWILI